MHTVAVLLPLLFVACSISQEPPVVALSPEVRQLVPDPILKTIEVLGVPVNTGEDPPYLEGTYLVTPFSLFSSSIRGECPGQIYSTYVVTFYEVSDDLQKFRINYSNGPESGFGVESAITGSGQDFTVFARIKSQYNGYKADLLHIVSGSVTDDGIRNLCFSSIIINNYGNPGQIWLDNGHGRAFIDSDGFSPMITIPGNSGQGGQLHGIANGFSLSSAELP